VPVQPAALELLSALAPVLARWGRWYLFGAQAVIIYGVPRLSADVDVTLALARDSPERFAGEMQAAGFSLRVDDPEFVRRTRVMPFVHLPTGMPLDVVLAGSGLEDQFLDRAVPTDIGGTTVPLIDLGDLIIAKVLEDLNDHARLRNDPLMQTACERDTALASAPTLCRLEKRASRAAAWAMHGVILERFIAGCWSQGASEKEALENIKETIRDYLSVVNEQLRGEEVREIEVAG
jgi:hypothetical protein